MTVEFVDTNVLIYAHEGKAGVKHDKSIELVRELTKNNSGGLSIQVLIEFYAAATKKLAMSSEEAEDVVEDFGAWTIHRPAHADLVRAARLHRSYSLSWWDALILNSATELGCAVLWSEDFSDGQHYGSVTVRNPFAVR